MSGVWAYAFVFGLFLAVISLFIPELGIELRWLVGWLGFLLYDNVFNTIYAGLFIWIGCMKKV